jgi:hypothetical protein
MSKLTEALRFHGRYATETQDEAAIRRNGEREAAATEIEALRASRDELVQALTRLCTQFPTDTDMEAAGWESSAISEACNAYDAARAALASSTDKPEQQTE